MPPSPACSSGAAQSVPADSELLTIALSASETAYSHDPSKAMSEPPALLAGGSAALVTLVQARNNARVAVAGSLDMFSDELFDAAVQDAADGASWPKSGNKDFCVQVARYGGMLGQWQCALFCWRNRAQSFTPRPLVQR